ncbi:MAG: hypothetical protein QNJ04_03765 [Desulfobacterales bacterium]|nr:hypothetical protein [Desulfobacterales bacterium]
MRKKPSPGRTRDQAMGRPKDLQARMRRMGPSRLRRTARPLVF